MHSNGHRAAEPHVPVADSNQTHASYALDQHQPEPCTSSQQLTTLITAQGRRSMARDRAALKSRHKDLSPCPVNARPEQPRRPTPSMAHTAPSVLRYIFLNNTSLFSLFVTYCT